MTHIRRAITSIAVLALVTACGQKGPLYLPQDSDRPANDALVNSQDSQKTSNSPL